jgi:hypothetical protein
MGGVGLGEPSEHHRQRRAAMGEHERRAGILDEVAGMHEPRHRGRSVGDATERVDEAVGAQAFVVAAVHGMDEQGRLAGMGHFPERGQVGIVEHAAEALGLGADHGAVEAGIECLLQHLGGMRAALHRHGRERHQRRQRLHAREQMLVVEAAPVGALVGGQFVAETVEPAAHHLAVDILLGHPGTALLDVAQQRHDRAGHLRAGEGKAQLAFLFLGLERGEQTLLRLHVGKQSGRNEMGVGVDDQVMFS